MSGAEKTNSTAGTVAEHDDLMQATDPINPIYARLGEQPKTLTMTACETLCWIGYGRVISQDIYYRPLFKIHDLRGDEAKMAILHASVPGPKPAKCPMGDAERKLMEALKAGRLRARFRRNGVFEVVPDEIYDYAISISARGGIEPDTGAAGRDKDQALDYLLNRTPKMKDIFFSTSEVLAWLTPWSNEAPLAAALSPPESAIGQFDVELKQWYANWSKENQLTSESDVWKAAINEFPAKGVTRQAIRDLRRLPDGAPRVRGRKPGKRESQFR